MTLTILVIAIGIAALILTLIMGLGLQRVKNWPISYLQNFTGALFVFSGWVKAIDPLGTAYKMEQYFAEFTATFSDTWFSFLAPVFPFLSSYVTTFSVVMIVFEIALGVMLLTGTKRKFTAWAFLTLVAFFTFLTGFTYLTGYVPNDVNFFQFSQWGPYVDTNMKVTDCGCFGDFLKLEPRVSFFKDLFLLIPAFIFVWKTRSMHQLFTSGTRYAVLGLTVVGLLLYCFSNFYWDIPHTDFRPFKVDNNIRLQKTIEEFAATSVDIEAYELVNKTSGEVVRLPYDEYLKQYAKYPKEEWEINQIKTEPKIVLQMDPSTNTYRIQGYDGDPAAETELVDYMLQKWDVSGDVFEQPIEASKISDFEVSDLEGNDVTEQLLNYPNYAFMVVAYKLYGDSRSEDRMRYDTVYQLDTVHQGDQIYLDKTVVRVDEVNDPLETFTWEEDYLQPWLTAINPLQQAAEAQDIPIFAVTAYSSAARIDDFRHATQSAYPFYNADDILLKTIVRSNPGVVLLKQGKVIMKWHYKKLPDFATIQENYMQ